MLQLTEEAVRIIRSVQAKVAERHRIKVAETRAGRRRRKLSEAEANGLVASVALILRTGEPTKFQFEAACRYGLRRNLIARGWRWSDADEAAADVVAKALHRIGAVRPDHYEGQPEHADNYSIKRYFCARCGTPLEEHDRKFCSKLCSNADSKQRNAQFGLQVSLAEYQTRLAERSAARLKECAADCESCGKPFIGSAPGTRFCSRECIAKGQERQAPIACVVCDKRFKGKLSHKRKYCSTACSAKARTKVAVPRNCEKCQRTFTPPRATANSAKFCSTECAQQGLVKPILPRDCVHCGTEFTPPIHRRNSETCSRQCTWDLKKARYERPVLSCVTCKAVFRGEANVQRAQLYCSPICNPSSPIYIGQSAFQCEEVR